MDCRGANKRAPHSNRFLTLFRLKVSNAERTEYPTNLDRAMKEIKGYDANFPRLVKAIRRHADSLGRYDGKDVIHSPHNTQSTHIGGTLTNFALCFTESSKFRNLLFEAGRAETEISAFELEYASDVLCEILEPLRTWAGKNSGVFNRNKRLLNAKKDAMDLANHQLKNCLASNSKYVLLQTRATDARNAYEIQFIIVSDLIKQYEINYFTAHLLLLKKFLLFQQELLEKSRIEISKALLRASQADKVDDYTGATTAAETSATAGDVPGQKDIIEANPHFDNTPNSTASKETSPSSSPVTPSNSLVSDESSPSKQFASSMTCSDASLAHANRLPTKKDNHKLLPLKKSNYTPIMAYFSVPEIRRGSNNDMERTLRSPMKISTVVVDTSHSNVCVGRASLSPTSGILKTKSLSSQQDVEHEETPAPSQSNPSAAVDSPGSPIIMSPEPKSVQFQFGPPRGAENSNSSSDPPTSFLASITSQQKKDVSSTSAPKKSSSKSSETSKQSVATGEESSGK